MSITECPHCHRRVIPSQSGICPSCNRDVRDQAAIDKGMRLLVVRGRQVFPSFCFNCAEPARKMVKVDVSNVDAGVAVERFFIGLLVPFGRLFSSLDAAKRDISFGVKLPICDACRRRKVKPEVQSYDLEDREMRLVVHERFREMAMNSNHPDDRA